MPIPADMTGAPPTVAPKEDHTLGFDLRRRRYGTSHGVGLLHCLGGREGTYAVALTASADLQQLEDAAGGRVPLPRLPRRRSWWSAGGWCARSHGTGWMSP